MNNTLYTILWTLAAIAVYAVSLCVNLGEAWLGGAAHMENLIVTAAYLLFWPMFTRNASSSRFLGRLCVILSSLTLTAATVGFLTRSVNWEILILPALFFTPFSSVPLYGLRYFTSWTGLELISMALSSVWLLYSLKKTP